MADGKYYSSSGTAAGIDMALGVVEELIDYEVAKEIETRLGYIRNIEDE